MCQNSLSLFVFNVFGKSKKNYIWEICFVLHFTYVSISFSQVFSMCFLFQTLWYLRLELYHLKSIFRIFVLWEKLFVIFQYCQELFVIIWITKLYYSLLCALLSAHLLCRGLCLRGGVVYLWCWVVIPQWKSFCGRSCVDIVKILLCEGGDVEQWLEPRNISSYLRWIFSLNSLSYIFHCFTLLISYTC